MKMDIGFLKNKFKLFFQESVNGFMIAEESTS